MALMASTAFAATQTADRGGENTISNKSTTITKVNNSNSADVTNVVMLDVSSGGNGVSTMHGDVVGNSIASGNASATVAVETDANSIDSTVNAPACGCSTEGVSPTGTQTADRGGENTVKSKNKDVAVVDNSNGASIGNLVGGSVQTGDNKVNSHHGDVKSNSVTAGMSGGTVTLFTQTGLIKSVVMR